MEPSKTLIGKYKHHYQTNSSEGKVTLCAILVFHSQAISQLYMTVVYIAPYLFSDLGDMAEYYFKVFSFYLFFMVEANWFCTLLYSSDLHDVNDKPTRDDADWFLKPDPSLQTNYGEAVESKVDKYGFEWRYCTDCKRFKPPRAHHCKVCQKCILRRDHHCLWVGRCIGHYNQRYFVVFCYLCLVISLLGLPLTVSYLWTLDDAEWWVDYFLPCTSVRYFFNGTVSWQFALLTYQCYVLVLVFTLSVFYFTMQISLVIEGKTLLELVKKIDIKITSSWVDNMRLVFGDYWLINFIFPAQIIFKQRNDGHHYDNIKLQGKRLDKE